jgi:hypothetical protein
MAKYIFEGKDIIYFDETTASIWEKNIHLWMDPKDKIVQKIPNSRGKGMTVLGAISSLWGSMHYTAGDKTD